MKDSTDRRLSTDTVAAAGRGRGTEAIAHPENNEPVDAAGRSTEGRETDLSPLFTGEEERDFRTRWKDIQTGFVDEPRQAVEQADELIAKLLHRLAESFSEQRSSLEHQWEKSDSVSTEDLRLALRRYRSFFDRLLSI
ncbi:MAG: hypothetical protein WD688_08755 [Candidatus Binatia bacterium]